MQIFFSRISRLVESDLFFLLSFFFCFSATCLSQPVAQNFFKLRLEGMGYSDETIIRFHPLATPGLDGNYDGLKLFSIDPLAANISTIAQGYDLAVNTLPEQNLNVQIPVRVFTGTAGSYTIFFELLDSLQSEICILFEDLQTSTQIDVRTQASYSFTSSDTAWSPRFLIRTTGKLNYAIANEGCPGSNDGLITISNPSGTSWELCLSNLINGQTDSISGDSILFSFPSLSPGIYILSSSNANQCAIPDDTLLIAPGIPVTSSFTASEDTVFIPPGNPVLFTSTQNGATSWLWDFGDGNQNDSTLNPEHVFLLPGQYEVTLTSLNSGCSDTSSMVITVISVVSIHEPEKVFFSVYGRDYLTLNFELPHQGKTLLHFFDLQGKMVLPSISSFNRRDSIRLPLSDLASGMYFCILEYGEVKYPLKFMVP
jgi:hypothetical protein